MKAPRILVWISILSVIGVVIAGFLTKHFYEIRSGLGGLQSFCNFGEKANCDVIALSPYAELFGLPLSSFGAGWMIAIFGISLLARNAYRRREALRALFVLSLTGLAVSTGYFLIMWQGIGTFCLLCLMLDAIQVVLFLLLLTQRAEIMDRTTPPNAAQWRVIFGGWASSMVIGVLALSAFNPLSLASEQVQRFAENALSTPVLAVEAGPELPSFGASGDPSSQTPAPITIVEFVDFQCPSCRIGAASMKALVTRYPNRIRVVYRAFPLDSSCNSAVPRPMHAAACEAAALAYCAHQQGQFKPVYELFFENQSTLAPGKLVSLIVSAGIPLDRAQLESCAASSAAQNAILKDVQAGIALNIESTPTFFFQGRKILGGYPLPVWEEILKRADR